MLSDIFLDGSVCTPDRNTWQIDHQQICQKSEKNTTFYEKNIHLNEHPVPAQQHQMYEPDIIPACSL